MNKTFSSPRLLNLSLDDIFNFDFYSRQTFSRSTAPLLIKIKTVDKTYVVGGWGGETIRDYWSISPDDFISARFNKVSHYSSALSRELFNSIRNVCESDFHAVSDKYNVKDKDITEYAYYETECRCHFGKFMLRYYLKGSISLSPIIDPDLRTLRLKTPECPDSKLLIAFIFARYEPDLLTFPFDSGHFIAPETIEYAKKINERFPRRPKDIAVATGDGQFNLQPRDLQAEKILAKGKNNPRIPGGLVEACLKANFDSNRTYGLFTTYFDNEIYHHAASYYESKKFGNGSHVYAILGTTKVLEDVEISQSHHLPYRDMRRFLEQDFALVHDDARVYSQAINKFGLYITATIMVKLYQNMNPEALKIVSVSDSKAKISKVPYHQKDGVCYSIKSYIGSLEIVAKALEDGQIRVYLSALFATESGDQSKIIPYWIDYTKFIINDETIFDTLTTIWHGKPYIKNMDVKAGEEVTIKVEWLPHRSDT